MVKIRYYHGSPTLIDSSLAKGTHVSKVESNALWFARFAHGRNGVGGYIYVLLLDAAVDLERRVDPQGTVDWVLVRDTPFFERFPVTDKLIAECKAESEAEGLK